MVFPLRESDRTAAELSAGCCRTAMKLRD